MKLYPSNDKLCEWMDDNIGVDDVDGLDDLMNIGVPEQTHTIEEKEYPSDEALPFK